MKSTTQPIKPGDIITDNHDRTCLVIKADKPESKAWLAGQSDHRMRQLPASEKWFEAYPLDGGAVIVPASLCTFLRRATHADVAAALKGGNGFAQDEIRATFPELCKESETGKPRDRVIRSLNKLVQSAEDDAKGFDIKRAKSGLARAIEMYGESIQVSALAASDAASILQQLDGLTGDAYTAKINELVAWFTAEIIRNRADRPERVNQREAHKAGLNALTDLLE